MYRVVLDPVVILRGLLNPHSPCRRLLFDYAERYQAVFSDDTVRAIRFLVVHPILIVAIPPLAGVSQTRLSQVFLQASRVHVPPEPGVSVFVAAARAARADFLVCEDRRLLEQREQLGVPVIQARPFLALLDPDLFSPDPDDTPSETQGPV